MNFVRTLLLCSCAAVLTGCQVTEDQLLNIVSDRGFQLVVPPSRLYAPGSLVNMQSYDPQNPKPKAVQLGFLCSPEYSIARYNKQPFMSATLDQYTITEFSGSLSGSVPALKRILD